MCHCVIKHLGTQSNDPHRIQGLEQRGPWSQPSKAQNQGQVNLFPGRGQGDQLRFRSMLKGEGVALWCTNGELNRFFEVGICKRVMAMEGYFPTPIVHSNEPGTIEDNRT